MLFGSNTVEYRLSAIFDKSCKLPKFNEKISRSHLRLQFCAFNLPKMHKVYHSERKCFIRLADNLLRKLPDIQAKDF